jgi:hypothetical protein
MKLIIMQFSPTCYHAILLWSKYSPQQPVLKHPQSMFLPYYQRPSFTPVQFINLKNPSVKLWQSLKPAALQKKSCHQNRELLGAIFTAIKINAVVHFFVSLTTRTYMYVL